MPGGHYGWLLHYKDVWVLGLSEVCWRSHPTFLTDAGYDRAAGWVARLCQPAASAGTTLGSAGTVMRSSPGSALADGGIEDHV